MANPSIDDLLKQYSSNRSSTPGVATEEAKEKFEEKMSEIALKEKEKIAQTKAAELDIPYINLKGFPISPETLTSIPKEIAEKLKIICFLNTGTEIRIGAVNPEEDQIKEILLSLEDKFHSHGEIYLISENSFNLAFKLYAALPTIKKIVSGVEISETDLEKFSEEIKSFKDLNEKIQKANITDIVTMVIASSIQARSSDIHIEAEEKDIKIRFRVDGVLADAAALPKGQWSKVISRIKLLSGLKINVTDIPQDGRFTIFVKDGKIDVRVSCLPTSYGESVVMRLLMPSTAGLGFDGLGLWEPAFSQLKAQTERPNGMIITTGPTGSGKTTTLYAILNKLNEPGVKIITLEDPVEYKLAGINQSQVDYSRDYTFAKGLKSILRQDPDVVMVGEIRDIETADIAIQAALTGHLVISTIHTNSASGAIPRFMSMGVKPFLLAPALNAVIGQRLVRKICENCKVEDKLDAEIMTRVKKTLETLSKEVKEKYKVDLENLKFLRGAGCPECNNLGYKGRIGIYEIMIMSAEIEKIILSGEISEYQMQDIATKAGMVTMVQDGLLKALAGVTSVSEVFEAAE
ncbi:type II/IV secretion system protein [Candidatus Falkowbacteria bacterium]|nr:type II/IV secretion system protein [Candidatus Falkowbacteria bacterium]